MHYTLYIYIYCIYKYIMFILFKLNNKPQLIRTDLSSIKKNKSNKLSKSTISSDCQIKVNGILAQNNCVENLFKACGNGSNTNSNTG